MDELVTWLHGVLDEIERVASSAQPGPWVSRTADVGWNYPEIDDADGEAVVVTDAGCYPPAQPTATHIALHDPRSVLARVEAERAIMQLHSGPHECSTWNDAHREYDSCGWVADGPCSTVYWLAYGHRHDGAPGWREEWAPAGVTTTLT